MDRVAAAHGVDLSRGEKVNLTPTDAVIAFRNGTVSAAVGWEPQVSAMLELGPSVAGILEVEYPIEHRFALVTTSVYAEKHPTVIRALLAATKDAIRFLHEHESSAVELVAQRTPMARHALERVWPYYHFELQAPTNMKGSLDLQLEWALRSKRVSTRAKPDLNAVLSNRQFQEWQKYASE